MYFVFQADNFIDNIERWAEAQGEMPNFLELGEKWHWWSDKPLPVPFPETSFIGRDDILLDRYQTGSIFDLYSERLAKTLYDAGVRCEYFSVKVLAKRSKVQVPIRYCVFHLMETLDAIDYEKSELIASEILEEHKNIVRMELTGEFIRKQRPLVRDSERPNILLIPKL